MDLKLNGMGMCIAEKRCINTNTHIEMTMNEFVRMENGNNQVRKGWKEHQ